MLLMVLAALAPVLATQPSVTPIKALQSGTITSIEKEWMSGDLRHREGVVNQGTIQLYIPDTASIPTYTFNFYNVYHAVADTIDQRPFIVNVDATWNYIVAGNVVGTFEGQINWNLASPFDAHGLLHGTGIFEGQILKFWEDPATTGTQWYGTLTVK